MVKSNKKNVEALMPSVTMEQFGRSLQEHARSVRSGGLPLRLTTKGAEPLFLVSGESLRRLALEAIDEVELRRSLDESFEQMRRGETYSLDEVFDDLRKELLDRHPELREAAKPAKAIKGKRAGRGKAR
jgi:PHD/YefM family antitoxin component YafN of YafNO toxin-antitoxin module